jgi:hypothetical protein
LTGPCGGLNREKIPARNPGPGRDRKTGSLDAGSAGPPLFACAVVLLCILLSGGTAFAQSVIEPRHTTIMLPESGLAWLSGEDLEGACEELPAEAWVRKPCGPFDLLVHAEGPSGSGRYWVLTAGIARAGEPMPERGVCLQTSTLGWRTLQHFARLPLPWVEDLDDDGEAELLIWDSFAMDADEHMADFGLIAWVYRVDAGEAFTLDWDLTRAMARELAAAYRSPLQPERGELQKVRDRVARALDKFVSAGEGEYPERSR